MPDSPRRLRALAAALWLASAASLAVALALPTVTFHKLASATETYSIYGGIRQLWEDGTHVLSAIVFLFSIVFPIAKLLMLAALYYGYVSPARRRAWLRYLELLGKWSMLDVYMVAVFVGSIRLGVLANASSRAGILTFGGSILLSMLCARVMARVEHGGAPEPVRPERLRRSWLQALLSLATLALLVLAFWLPVFEVKKALFFKSLLELSRTTWKMAGSGELTLALTIGLLVIATSIARALTALHLRCARQPSERVVRRALLLEEWAMLDVLAFALVIVHTKLDQLTDTTRQAGFFCALAAAVLMELDGWLIRRAVRGRSAPEG